MSKTISVADLERLGACEGQVKLFFTTFHSAFVGVEVTVENVLKALKAGLGLDWLAKAVFTTPGYVKYRRIQAQAWKAYLAVQRPAYDVYARLLTTIPKASRCAIGVSVVKYNRVEKAAGEKYHLAEATAWVAAYEASVEVAGKGEK